MQEARALRSQVHLAEQARRAAQSMEQDYVDVLKRLEVDLLELKAREAKVMVSIPSQVPLHCLPLHVLDVNPH